MLHLSEFVWTLRSSVLVVFNNILLIDTTDRSKISSDQMRFFIALSLYTLSFFANTPFKKLCFSYIQQNCVYTKSWKKNIHFMDYRIYSLKYLRSTTLCCKNIGIRKSEILAKTLLLCLFQENVTKSVFPTLSALQVQV